MKLPPPDPDVETPFGNTEEEATVSLALDHPEFFSKAAQLLKPQMFKRAEVQYIVALILEQYQKYEIVPSRAILRDLVMKDLTADDPYDEVLKIIDRESNAREVPIVKNTLFDWIRNKAYGELYGSDAQIAFQKGDYAYLEKIFEDARKLVDSKYEIFWFFEQYREAILNIDDPHAHFTTGYPRLDKIINNGGPGPGEVMCFLAPTNVGKSIVLANVAMRSLAPRSVHGTMVPGENVLLVSFEMTPLKIAKRELGILTGVNLDTLANKEGDVSRRVEEAKLKSGQLAIVELPPEECNVDHLADVIDSIKKTRGWRPRVIVIDYLDLMLSRISEHNGDSYERQKYVSSQLCGLAKKEKAVIFTATQTNRSGVGTGSNDGKGQNNKGTSNIHMGQSADSFGKMFGLDYVVSLNQDDTMRSSPIPTIRFWVDKNRDGQKHVSIDCEVNYNNMRITEQT